MHTPTRMTVVCLSVLTLIQTAGFDRRAEAQDRAAALEHFEKRVRPLFIERCHKCHASEKAKGGLRLDSAEAIRRGGESGPVLVPGKPEESRLIQAIRHQGGLKMPPDGKLTEAQMEVVA